jgi:hypothetical protein
MKNVIALGIGMALILAAILLAAGTTSRDVAPRPEVARVFATELHATPSATPTATMTPTVTPTPLHLTRPEPEAQEVLAKLFQYPYQGTTIGTSSARVDMHWLYLNGGTRRLIVTGDRVMAGRGMHVASGAFGAVMVWENGEYVVNFLRVVLGHGDMFVGLSASPDGLLVFRFHALELKPDVEGLVQHTFVLHPCNVPVGSATVAAIESAKDLREWDCY